MQNFFKVFHEPLHEHNATRDHPKKDKRLHLFILYAGNHSLNIPAIDSANPLPLSYL
jgi:hypothetical protein